MLGRLQVVSQCLGNDIHEELIALLSVYNLLKPLLTAQGYPVVTVSFPSVNAPTALPSDSADVAAVRSAVNTAVSAGKTVYVIMHS